MCLQIEKTPCFGETHPGFMGVSGNIFGTMTVDSQKTQDLIFFFFNKLGVSTKSCWDLHAGWVTADPELNPIVDVVPHRSLQRGPRIYAVFLWRRPFLSYMQCILHM